ncbi:unnamed protein product [Diabrotica balteata]|uniref:Uncharacterized protein n=1 Tax=Diabrotica balteata TaxID=107213 RepID=A0A9N9SZ88_DIABA|nr:unnamed protein product [Diabrotica balteata]
MEVIKQETSEETCEVEIENSELDDALLDRFKGEIKEESNLESTDDTFDRSALKEFPIKTEIEQDGNKLTRFKGKRKINEEKKWKHLQELKSVISQVCHLFYAILPHIPDRPKMTAMVYKTS